MSKRDPITLPPDRNRYRRVCGWCGGTFNSLVQDVVCDNGTHRPLFTGIESPGPGIGLAADVADDLVCLLADELNWQPDATPFGTVIRRLWRAAERHRDLEGHPDPLAQRRWLCAFLESNRAA